MDKLKRIHTKAELKELAIELGVGKDWHEPDNQSVDAFAFGGYFDNAGHWGLEHWGNREREARMRLLKAGDTNTVEDYVIEDAERFVEMFIVLYREGRAVAEINLATLFAFACDTCAG